MNGATTVGKKANLPDVLTVECHADGMPRSGLLVLLTVVMARKNSYTMIFGPSGDRGEIKVARTDILAELQRDRDLFPADYEDLDDFSEGLLVEPMGLQAIESAMRAYDLYKVSQTYPVGHRDKLELAWKTLYEFGIRRLDVEIAASPSTTTTSAPPLRLGARSILVGGEARG